ncbi:MAG: glycosyltransferase [Promethearchaeota archaeon]
MNSYENQVTRKKARGRLALSDREIVFLYFGTIRPNKGVLRLTDTFRKFQSRRVRLLIVGEPASEAIRSKIMRCCKSDSRIRAFLQFVPAKDVQLYLNAADVVVLPFQDILTSGSALLAMSFGKPVIAPRMGCIPEVLDSRGAFLYDHNEKEGILKAIHQVFSANLAAMGEYNYCKAKLFDWNMIAQKTCALYQL